MRRWLPASRRRDISAKSYRRNREEFIITLALPAYNEAEIIVDVVTQIVLAALRATGEPWELLLIDNASSDDTPKLIAALAESCPGLRLIRHDSNRLYSGSCATALREALRRARDHNGSRWATHGTRHSSFPVQARPGERAWSSAGAASAMIPFNAGRSRRYSTFSARYSCATRITTSIAVSGPSIAKLAAGAKIVHRINLANPELYTRARQLGLPVAEVEVSHFERAGGKSSHNLFKFAALFIFVLDHFKTLHAELS